MLAAALILVACAIWIPATAQASFAISAFDAQALNGEGAPADHAGVHPERLELGFSLNGFPGSLGDLRDLDLTLPPGFLVNPTVTSECSAVAFATPRISPYQTSLSGESCPSSSQVGVVAVHSAYAGGSVRYFGLFNLVPPYGSAASFGLAPFGVPIVFNLGVRESDSALTLSLSNLSQAIDIRGLDFTFWGIPWQAGPPENPGHDDQRGNCLNEVSGGSFGGCAVFGSSGATVEQIHTLLTIPTTPCGANFRYEITAGSWQGEQASAAVESEDAEGHPLVLRECKKILTTPKVQLMSEDAAARTGLAFNLTVNDGGGILNPGGIARPAAKEAILHLPEGLTINPSLGSGLGTCTEADFARESARSAPGAGCPNASKVGDVAVEGMLGLPDTELLRGSLFIAKPRENPFGALIAVYLVASNPRRGLFVRSVGKIDPDPHSGRLTASFQNLPRLLYTHFNLTFREGQRSVMVSPPSCGSYPARMELNSWADPTLLSSSSAFLISHGQGGGPCPGATLPFTPGLEAGSINPAAGAYTPFYLHMTRTDQEQEITSYSATLPAGLLGNLSGLASCPDAAIEAAKQKSGTEELQHPSCPAASQIGHTTSGYGVGGVLAYAPGGLYLAGPYHGAPLSTVAIDSALVGPFDLGVVIVRSAIRVDPASAQVRVDSQGSDPIPHILGGIPLHLRDIRVYIDRPHFTVNGTGCDPTRTLSTLTGAGADLYSPADDVAAISDDRYQLANCSILPFKPRLRFRFTSGFKRRAFPSLRTELRPRAGDANPRFVSVTLPRTEFIAQAHLRNYCTRSQFDAAACPPDSVYGRARAFTPLLDSPLEGPVYLRSAPGLPDMVFALRGPGGLAVDVVGHIDSVHESLRATFPQVPDAPLTKFTMTLFGGRKGLLENEKDICSVPQFANARLVAHSNLGAASRPRLETRCPKKSKRANR